MAKQHHILTLQTHLHVHVHIHHADDGDSGRMADEVATRLARTLTEGPAGPAARSVMVHHETHEGKTWPA